jgi:N-acetylglucosamine-6-phosphate deacetylase
LEIALTVLTGGRVVSPGGVLDPGWVEVAGARIAETGRGSPPKGASHRHDLGGSWLLPGFVDLHMHGGGGYSVTESGQEMAAAVAFHRAQGTTSTLVSALTAPIEQMCAVAGWAAALARRGRGAEGHVIGSHLEGPFLSKLRCGAQDPHALLPPDPAVLRRLLAAGAGTVRVMTVAPELPGGLELVCQLDAAGTLAAIGHTDAGYIEAAAALDRGARLLTHTFNCMRGLGHRDPGPVAAAVECADAVLELINDGEHVHDPVVRLLFALAPGRVALVTDAMAAAGAGDGEYRLGGRRVEVRGGRAVLAGGTVLSGGIAGSTLTMAGAVRRAVTEVGLPIQQVAAAASEVPARLLGLRCGRIEAGYHADLVVLNDELRVTAVMADGKWCR